MQNLLKMVWRSRLSPYVRYLRQGTKVLGSVISLREMSLIGSRSLWGLQILTFRAVLEDECREWRVVAIQTICMKGIRFFLRNFFAEPGFTVNLDFVMEEWQVNLVV